MKEIMLKKKKLILMIFVLSILLIGSTYALLTIDLFGEKTNSIIVGNLELILNEDSCNGITIEKGIPVTDIDGMKQVACTFSVENTGNLDSIYSVLIEDMELNLSEERVNDSDIKYGLVKNNSTAMIGLVSELDDNGERVLDSSILKVGNINTYELRFWVKYDASADSMNKTFLTNIKLVGENYDISSGVIPNITDYYTYGYLDELDYYGDGSYMMTINANHVSMTPDFKNAVLYNLSFTDSIGNIWNPGDSLPNPGNTFVENGIVKNVESMVGMFASYLSDGSYVDVPINYLDLSLWDTSNVINMNGMFEDSYAETLDLSSFDTSNVTDMGYMFADSPATSLDVSNFDTSKVTNMSGMFAWSAATSLDVSNFDTSKVTNMGGMFRESAATILDLSGFDTSNVTDMSKMFSYSAANPIYVKDQAMLDRFVAEGSADSTRLQIK